MLFKTLRQILLRRLKALFLVRKIRDIHNFLEMGDIVQGLEDFTGVRVLVLSPHPDDESIGCGGTLRLITLNGGVVDVLYLTKGESAGTDHSELTADLKERMKRKRVLEAEEACTLLGVRKTIFLDGADSGLHAQRELSKEVAAVLEAGNYKYVFCPWPYDAHSDHAATFHHFARALHLVEKEYKVWLYEVWNPLVANRIVTIDETMSIKLEAIGRHRSQLDLRDYTDKFIGLAKYRSVYVTQAQYAEAFMTIDSRDLLRMRKRVPPRMGERSVLQLAPKKPVAFERPERFATGRDPRTATEK